MTTKEIEQLAESQWEGCQGCDENDKNFWISGFIFGYLNARVNSINDRIDETRKKISDLLINGGETPQKKTWVTSKKDKAFIRS